MTPGVYSFLSKIIRLFFIRAASSGSEKIGRAEYAVCIGNHLGAFGPVAILSSLSIDLYPWVTHEILAKKQCAGYLRMDFVEPELKLRPPLSNLLSAVIGRICRDIMTYIEAVPVYRNSKKISETLDTSISFLRSGRSLLIFPENEESKKDDDLCILDTGFIQLARQFFFKTGKLIDFFPVSVNKKFRTIRVGDPVRFIPGNPYSEEKVRIKRLLEKGITALYSSPPEEYIYGKKR